MPAPYTAYCEQYEHRSAAHCVALEAQREKIKRKAEQAQGKRSIIAAGVKSVPAIHLSNLTSVFPVFGVDVHDLSKRSFTYDPKNEKTIDTLTYGSPWAVMQAYNPRNAVFSARSIIPADESEGNPVKKVLTRFFKATKRYCL